MYNNDSKKRGHAIALFSGGLDSALAILLILKQNIEVTALTFMTHFGCDLGDRSSCGSDPYPASEKFGFNVKLMHLGQKFVDIVKDPKHGYGSEMNVCVDCRILMLREASQLMKMLNADFIVTGEVLGQRPFSQVRDKIHLVARKADVKGKLLRPLSAKLLPPTEPELSGLIDREQLEGISGRSRKRQIELAAQFGLEDYPTPAGGCLLTDKAYSARLRDLLTHTEHVCFTDLNLLKTGRHFRLDPSTKIVMGRNERENRQLAGYQDSSHYKIEAADVGSPHTILIGDATETNLKRAASITARYSANKTKPEVKVVSTRLSDGLETEWLVGPASEAEIKATGIR